DPEPLHLGKQLAAARADAAGRMGTLGIRAGTVMGRPERSQALRVGPFEMTNSDDRVGPFEAEDIADGRVVWRGVAPERRLPLQARRIDDRHQLACLFH